MAEKETNDIKDCFNDMIVQFQVLRQEKEERFEKYRELVRNDVRAMTKQRDAFYEAWDKKTRDLRLNQVYLK
jgi:hypothetical protein